MDMLDKVKQIQIARGLNDREVSVLLGYRHRTGWARIKTGVSPPNEVFLLRALKAFPELGDIPSYPAEKPQERSGNGIKALFDKVVLIVRRL